MKKYKNIYTYTLLGLFSLTLGMLVGQVEKPQEIRQRAQTAAPAGGAALYVSANGTGDCSQASPCAFATADGKASPGTTIHVAPGNYGTVVMSKSGTAAAHIHWISDTKWGAKISGNATSNADVKGAYVDFEGFDVAGGSNTQNIINVAANSAAIGNHVHDLPRPCTYNGGINTEGGGARIIGNLIENIGQGTPGSCNELHGIYMGTNDIVENNVIINIPEGSGIHSYHDTTHVTIINNTVTQAGADGILVGSDTGSNTGGYIANNISYNNHRNGLSETGTAAGNTFVNNLSFGNAGGPTSYSSSAKSSGEIDSDPMFVNAAGKDFHLKPGSPAIDKGAAQNAPTTDFDGHPRPQGAAVDIGAFESGTAGATGASPAPGTGSAPSGTTNPSFVALAPCPSCVSPSVVPDLSGAVQPSVSDTNPSEVVNQPGPSVTPCDASVATDNSFTDARSHKHHKKHTGSVSGGMEQLLKLLIELINKILQLLGGGQINLPSTTPSTGEPAPGSSGDQNPAPCPSTSSAPSESTTPSNTP